MSIFTLAIAILVIGGILGVGLIQGRIKEMNACQMCDGSGRDPLMPIFTCLTCDGSGEKRPRDIYDEN